jgi:hypothetical protein
MVGSSQSSEKNLSNKNDWVIRDPIHGYVELTGQEIRIIDTAVFQRLRGIRQLANTCLVFPGATHTRFEHSLGTLCVASRMIDRIDSVKNDPNRRRQIRLAALLHDLGHGPFSHVCEDVVARVIDPGCQKKSDEFRNVCIARDAIELDESLRDIVGADVDTILKILDPKGEGIEHDFVDGPVDADKHDYLIRDSYFTGVPYGQFDALRTVYSLREIEGDGEKKELGISMKGVEAVQSLKFARYNMHRVVYNHKTRVVADAMVTRAIMIALDEDGVLERNLFAYRERDKDFVKGYMGLDDRELLRTIQTKGKLSKEIMDMVARRNLLKLAYEVEIADLKGRVKLNASTMNRIQIARHESELAADAGIEPYRLIIAKENIENPTYRHPAGIAPEERGLLVDRGKGKQPVMLDEVPGIWSADQKLVVNRLRVFCTKDDRVRVADLAARLFEKE